MILGDSMTKNIRGWEISKKLQNANVYVKHFSRAKVRCMKDYLKPSIRENPDHFVLHVGTNDLDSERSPDLIAKSIVDVASSLNTKKHDVTISNIITRNDRFMAKAHEVNQCLTEICFESNFLLIDHSKTLKLHHLNGSKLHLNRRGTPILQNTFPKALGRSLRFKKLNKLIKEHLNINSLRNKFELLMHQIKDNIDTLMISETNLDESLPKIQFFMKGFGRPHCIDGNCNGGGILLYIREDTPSKLLSIERNLTEAFFVEIDLHKKKKKKKKWLIICSYNPKRASITNHSFNIK